MTTRDDRPDPDDDVSMEGAPSDRERDGVGALHDTEAEAGDETELTDLFDLDRVEAHELGVDLDPADGGESQLD